MAFQDASSRVSVSITPTTQPPSSVNLSARRSRSISRKRKSLFEKFLSTFGTKRFKRIKKATQNFFAFVSMIVVGIAGVIYLISSMLRW